MDKTVVDKVVLINKEIKRVTEELKVLNNIYKLYNRISIIKKKKRKITFITFLSRITRDEIDFNSDQMKILIEMKEKELRDLENMLEEL